jgi:hypothetical protein
MRSHQVNAVSECVCRHSPNEALPKMVADQVALHTRGAQRRNEKAANRNRRKALVVEKPLNLQLSYPLPDDGMNAGRLGWWFMKQPREFGWVEAVQDPCVTPGGLVARRNQWEKDLPPWRRPYW